MKTRRTVKDKRNKQVGVRRRYTEALDDIRFIYPRANLAKRPADFYTDGHLVESRPLVSILALANYAEYLLYRAKFGRYRIGEMEAMRFFASTRRAMFFVLKHFPSDRALYKSEANSLRPRVEKLVALARCARNAVSNTDQESIHDK